VLDREELARLRAKLIQLQLDEPRHKKIGTRDKYGDRIPLDEICRRCPSRRPCRSTSVAMADIESKIL
jgi:hypothetical protein